MKKFKVEELESRFEMAVMTTPDGQQVEVAELGNGAYSVDGVGCECTSTCRPE